MLRRWTFRVVIATCLSIGLVSAAEAQIRFTSTGGFVGGPTFANFPAGGMWGGSPWGGMSGGNPGWGWNSPYYASYSGWTTYPGIAAISTNPAPRARATLSPAVAVDPDVLHPRSTIVRQANYSPEGGTSQQAAIHVLVPVANAEVWFDGVRVQQKETEREYLTPPLENGKYTYDVRVRWTAGGKEQTFSRTINFRPGDRIRVDASQPSEQLPAPKTKT